jgi:hypothetical protein
MSRIVIVILIYHRYKHLNLKFTTENREITVGRSSNGQN